MPCERRRRKSHLSSLSIHSRGREPEHLSTLISGGRCLHDCDATSNNLSVPLVAVCESHDVRRGDSRAPIGDNTHPHCRSRRDNRCNRDRRPGNSDVRKPFPERYMPWLRPKTMNCQIETCYPLLDSLSIFRLGHEPSGRPDLYCGFGGSAGSGAF